MTAHGDEKQPAGPGPLLRQLRATVEAELQPRTRVKLPALCDEIGLPDAPDDDALTKAEYIRSRLAKLRTEDDARSVAVRFVSRYPLGGYGNDGTYHLEELLWQTREPHVSPRVRRELAAGLNGVELFTEPDAFIELLARRFVLGIEIPLFKDRNSLRWKIQQHVVRNPEDWSVSELSTNSVLSNAAVNDSGN